MADPPTRRHLDRRTANPTRRLHRRIQPPPTTPLPAPPRHSRDRLPGPPQSSTRTRVGTHDRVRTDRIGQAGSITLRLNGRLHHIGVGRIHYRTRVLILTQDLNIRIINAAAGELL